MDPTGHNLRQPHQNQLNNNSNQQQQYSHLNSSTAITIGSPGQLPDESYIEKLFPKCQPLKQPNKTRTAANGLGLQMRPNRAKMHQHHRRDTLETVSKRKDNTSHKTSNPIGASSSKKCNEVDFYNSSTDSTDNESSSARMKGDKIHKLRSSSTDKELNNESQQRDSSRSRTRKYKGSKNLQPRYRRSQSQSNPTSICAQIQQIKSTNQVGSAAQSSASNTEPNSFKDMIAASPPTVAVPSDSNSCHIKPSETNDNIPPRSESISTMDSDNRPKNSDNIRRTSDSKATNRNNRGIVFSDSLSSFNSNDFVSRQLINLSSASALGEDKGDESGLSVTSRLSHPCSIDPISQHQTALVKPNLHQDINESTQISETDLSRIDSQSSGAPITSATVTSYDLYDQNPERSQHISHSVGSNDIAERSTKLMLHHDQDHLDEDRYINLFVYDNPGPQRKIGDSDTLNNEQNYEKSDHPNSVQNNSQSRHKLLSEDLNENDHDVIRNDTSIEELCSFDDNIVEVSKSNALQVHDSLTSSVENGNSTQEEASHPTSTDQKSFTNSKPHSRNNRLIGTLQTVDEKLEIAVDDNCENISSSSETSKTELIDISDTIAMQGEDNLKITKRGGVASPGYPRQVRPQEKQAKIDSSYDNNSNNEIPPCLLDNSKNILTSRHQNDRASSSDSGLPKTNTSPVSESLQKNVTVANETLDIVEAGDGEHRQIEGQLADSMRRVSLVPRLCELDPPETIHAINSSQHHKLPNETRHFSILCSANKALTSQRDTSEAPRSRIQFSTLSDAESEPDDQPNIVARTSRITAGASRSEKKLDRAQVTYPVNDQNDDDSTPTNRTALIFPRLDEGLSSDAESCEDDVDEDDERAIEGDVDADDEEGNEDDGDSPLKTSDRHTNPPTLGGDNYIRNQAQPKSILSTVSSLPNSTNNISAAPTVSDIDAQQIKHSSNTQFSNFLSTTDALDQNDLKSLPVYPSHNGQSNYWMSQPSTSNSQQTFALGRNQQHLGTSNGNNNNISRSNSYISRDEAKAVNRFSSDTDNETDRLLGTQRNDQLQRMNNNELVSHNSTTDNQVTSNNSSKTNSNSREVLIEGVLFPVKYLGSTDTECEGRGEKEDRMHQAELAVHEVKFRNGDQQTPVEVQLFISTEKIMVLDDKHRKIMMDHSLRLISYIADVGGIIVLIARKKNASIDTTSEMGRPTAKSSCHVFESNESQTITKSISQAFQVAYTELLKANGVGDSGSYLPKELDYQEVLNSQEMSTTELEMFARKDNQRDVIVPKKQGEILGLSIVESGWGSVLPTAVIASLKPDGPAYRCKNLSVGDQILSINGISLVGLSLAECQKILRKTKTQSVARLSIVPCPITVEVKIKRPDTKYQLGFSVQHGVICSLLRGGIAERGGVRVGHRIISINGTTVVGVPHDKIVTLLASSVGEIRMKTCLTSLYRHMLGEEKNVSFV